MNFWQKSLVMPKATLRHTMKVISAAATQLALVVEPGGKLIGTVSDGDIRSALLNNFGMDDCVELIMNRTPIVALLGTSKQELISLMASKAIRQIPIVDQEGLLHGLELLDENLKPKERENLVLLMAGGLGNRLKPLTDDCPKPLLKVRGRPILEWIIEGFKQNGFHNFIISANYKAEMIQDYFSSGEKLGVKINYLVEKEKLGTAGALNLFENRPSQPFFVMNGDLLTQINFAHMLDYHKTQKNSATMAVQEYQVEVPYGVIESQGSTITKITEKPTYQYLINSGVYVFSPEVFDYLSPKASIDIPVIFERMIQANRKVEYFSINGYWIDIGRREDLEKAHFDFEHQLSSIHNPAINEGKGLLQ